MPDEIGEIRQRLERVEGRMDTLENMVDTKTSLRAKVDRDIETLTSWFDAQSRLLRALATTQSEHGHQLRKLTVGQDEMNVELQRIDVEQERATAMLGVTQEGVQTIIGLLGSATDRWPLTTPAGH